MGHSSDDKCYYVFVVDRSVYFMPVINISKEGGRGRQMEPYVICIRLKEGANLRQGASYSIYGTNM